MTTTKAMATTPEELQRFCRERNVQIADLRFTDLPGIWQHFSVPVSELDDAAFTVGLDGSSIRGFQTIDQSDMMLVPDLSSAFIDPVLNVRTLALICNVRDPVLQQPYSRDPRHVAQKAEAYLQSTGIADISYWGPVLEHFIFDDARFHQDEHSAYYYVDSDEGIWNSGRDGSYNGRPNLGHRPRYKQGYFPTPPMDSSQDIAGQGEIDMRFHSLTRMADQVMVFKYIIKNVARAHGKVATFMPKPLFGDNGSGMQCTRASGMGTPTCSSQGLRAGQRAMPPLHRRAVQAWRCADGLPGAHGQLLSAASPWVRGSRKPRLLAAQPQCGGSHPHTSSPKGKRVECRTRLIRQPLFGLRHAHGRPRWHSDRGRLW